MQTEVTLLYKFITYDIIYLLLGLWNLIFLGSYLSLFVAIPFAYFFIESEGFAGSKKVKKSNKVTTIDPTRIDLRLNQVRSDCVTLV